jgi:hypothetical protein
LSLWTLVPLKQIPMIYIAPSPWDTIALTSAPPQHLYHGCRRHGWKLSNTTFVRRGRNLTSRLLKASLRLKTSTHVHWIPPSKALDRGATEKAREDSDLDRRAYHRQRRELKLMSQKRNVRGSPGLWLADQLCRRRGPCISAAAHERLAREHAERAPGGASVVRRARRRRMVSGAQGARHTAEA